MKRRSESFFGLHFDFHASPEGAAGTSIGATLKEEEIREICRLLKPDFLQIDCKGHPGWASYPTAVGNAMPDFALDPLALWRKVTREEGVALYMHYSGVIDKKYLAEHPGEGCLKADGTRDDSSTRTMGRYVDELLIPQLTELAEKYGVDGVWVDGDCWGSRVDFDPETVGAFEKETGIDLGGRLPAERGDPYFEEYREFCRELFRRYVRKYVNALHEKAPDFQVASNWSYTDHMPEEVSAPVDFISGDLSPEDSFASARYAGRAIASQERTWDLMSWNFRHMLEGKPGHVAKHPVQILQEAAAVISLGGGFQNYITQYRDGSPRMAEIRRMKALADFMRAREPFSFRGKPERQVVLLLSTWDRHRESDSLYSRNGCEKIAGMTNLICDAGHSLEIAEEHTLLRHGYDYPVIVVPELFAGLAPETVKDLLSYAAAGGSLLLAGKKTAEIFSAAGAPFRLKAGTPGRTLLTRDGAEFAAAFDAGVLSFEKGETLWKSTLDERKEGKPAAAVLPYGRGKIAVLSFDPGTAYHASSQYLHRTMIRDVLDRLYQPRVRLEKATGLLEIVDLRKDGKLMIQLVNANGNHRAAVIATEDQIPPCLDAEIAIRLPQKPASLRLEPLGKELSFTYEDGEARVRIPRIDLHEVIVVDE
ncbi:MAG: alpha-L-fucosidase [Clostridia bacterium]|nr:alpha-L-fucosidase [Clostridia bacterium]